MIIPGLVLTIFAGYLVSCLLIEKKHLIERIGLSFPLGIGLQTLFTFFSYMMFGFKISSSSMWTVLFTIILISSFIFKLTKTHISFEPNNLNFKNINKYEVIIFIVFGLLLIISFINNLYWPLSDWDSIALYDFRAKVLFFDGDLGKATSEWTYFLGYPLLTTLAHLWMYFLGFSNPTFIYTFYYFGLALVTYGVLKRLVKEKFAILGFLFIITQPILFGHSMVAYTNLPYTYYYCLSLFYLFLGVTKGNIRLIVLSSILVGLSTWTRSSEPFWVTNIIVILIYALAKRNFILPVKYFLIFSIFKYPWGTFERNNLPVQGVELQGALTKNIVQFITNMNFNLLISVAKYLYQAFLVPSFLTMVLFLIFTLIQIMYIKNVKTLIFLALIVFNLGLIFAGTYLLATYFESWNQIPDSVYRMSMFLIPLIGFYSILTIDDYNSHMVENKKNV